MSHASTEQLIALELGELQEREAESLRAHLEACGSCQAERVMAAEFARESREPLPDAQAGRMLDKIEAKKRSGHTPARIRPHRSWLPVALVAAAVVFAAVGIYQFRGQQFDAGLERVLRSPEAESQIPLRAEETAEGWLLSWDVSGGAANCVLELRSTGGEVIWTRAVEGGSLMITRAELFEAEAVAPRFVSLRCTAAGQEIESRILMLNPSP